MLVGIGGKYDGIVAVGPSSLRLGTRLVTAKYEARHPDVALPCDAEGRPVTS